jgi:hypothetical protein
LVEFAPGWRGQIRLPAIAALGKGSSDLDQDFGRRQNKKYRPIVRELWVQTKLLEHWETKGLALRAGRLVWICLGGFDRHRAAALARERCGQDPAMSAYSIRHRVTSALRASKKPPVPGSRFHTGLGLVAP